MNIELGRQRNESTKDEKTVFPDFPIIFENGDPLITFSGVLLEGSMVQNLKKYLHH